MFREAQTLMFDGCPALSATDTHECFRNACGENETFSTNRLYPKAPVSVFGIMVVGAVVRQVYGAPLVWHKKDEDKERLCVQKR